MIGSIAVIINECRAQGKTVRSITIPEDWFFLIKTELFEEATKESHQDFEFMGAIVSFGGNRLTIRFGN